MCTFPTLILNRKYTPNKKNGGIIPPITDERTKYVAIGCQYCTECRKQKARAWQARLTEDIKHNTNGKFITLTFSTKYLRIIDRLISIKEANLEIKTTGYDRDNAIATYATRKFLERYRKEHKKSLRHWLVTELGQTGTEHLHMHGIVWTDKSLDNVEKHWKYGFAWKGERINGRLVNYVNETTVNYLIKYVNKIDPKHRAYRSKILTSPGIGKDYTNTSTSKTNAFKGKETQEYYTTRTGHKLNLPIYWRNKIYTQEQREKLWIQRLDANVRYINGEKIKVATNTQMQSFYKILEWHQQRSREMGQAPPSWQQQVYERQRRNMLRNQRLKKTMEASPIGFPTHNANAS